VPVKPVKSVKHPTSGKVYKLGRKRPVARCPRFALKNYLARSTPPPPASVDYTAQAKAALGEMYENDTLGDCVIAGMAHVVGLMTGNADGGKPFIYTDKQITTLYSAIGGYVPGDPSTDNGCDEQTALNYWENNGAPKGSHEIAGWMAVDATNQEECELAMYLFENLYFGLELPDAWINPFPSAPGFTWDVAGDPDPNNGHCVVGVGYNAQGIQIDTWGMTGTMTWAAVARYAVDAAGGALYTVVSIDSISKVTQKGATGFDWSQLIADFDSMGGNVKSVIAAKSAGVRA
jgi:hypothetical protein